MRVFVSVNWSTEVLSWLQSIQRFLQEAGVKGYWRDRNNLHLTLKFLGEIDPGKISGVDRALRRAQSGLPPFELNWRGLGVFPDSREPRILWAGVESPGLLKLQGIIQGELAKAGYPPENRPFRPHVTLASGGIAGFNPSLAAIPAGPLQRIGSFELMESLVERGKRKYLSLNEYPLTV